MATPTTTELPGPARTGSPSHARTRSGTGARRALILAAVTAVVGGLVALAVLWAPLRRQVLLSTTQRPTPYNELYFSNYAALPRLVFKGRTYPIPYTVVGHHERSKTVVAEATVDYGTRHQALGRQTLTYGRGGRATGVFQWTVPVRYSVYFVTISLPGGQSISWRVVSP